MLKKLFPEAFKHTEKTKTASTGTSNSLPPLVIVEGIKNIQTKFAKCCNPIKGEPIVAYITKKSEFKIHSADCSYLKSVELEKENFKKAEWLFETESIQIVKLWIYGDSYTKALTDTVSTADDESIKIISTRKIPTKAEKEGMFLEAEVKDIAQLERFIAKLKASPAVQSIHHV